MSFLTWFGICCTLLWIAATLRCFQVARRHALEAAKVAAAQGRAREQAEAELAALSAWQHMAVRALLQRYWPRSSAL
eukprot:CAMPEP_0115666554 /NCGR_PEP_ID=MMETSP0272-20121206/49474_1 /TAXON_ID=71861 /ORGANISM="Scrippsiella trochoidea, Strain CCMP3099" /LENGTH=76 /DNA_ID=CAMNT_0003105053 /DNA_START=507 /DNA_END=737 /DNA_ORIENTATION=-